MTRRVAPRGAASTLRRGLLGLAGLGVVGTGLELAFLGHWDGALQLVAWLGIALLAAALAILARTRSSATIRVVRALAGLAVVVGVVGVLVHVNANLEEAPLDRDLGSGWDARPLIERLWLAATGQVGPAPALAPGALAQTALAILLATVRGE